MVKQQRNHSFVTFIQIKYYIGDTTLYKNDRTLQRLCTARAVISCITLFYMFLLMRAIFIGLFCFPDKMVSGSLMT